MSPVATSSAGLWSAVVSLLALLPGALSQNGGCGNVTISSAEDAARIGRSCRTIEGDILWAKGLAGKITLDGVEIVKGNIGNWTRKLSESELSDALAGASMDLSMPTLRRIEGGAKINYWGNVRSVEMPLLESVGDGFVLEGDSVQHLDITSLERVGVALRISCDLQTLSHRRLLEYSPAAGGYGTFSPLRVGGVGSVDSFYGRARISGAAGKNARRVDGVSLVLDASYLPNVTHFSLAWTDLVEVVVGRRPGSGGYDPRQKDVTLELGSGSTAPQVISDLGLYTGVAGVNLSSPDVRLTGDRFVVQNTSLAALTVPHSELARLEVRNNSRLTSVELLPSVSDGAGLTSLIIEQKDVHLKRWSWPKGPMETIAIVARVDEEFFQGFKAMADQLSGAKTPAYVNKNFTVIGQPGSNFSCNFFDQLWQTGRFPRKGSYGPASYVCIEDVSLPSDTRRDGKVFPEVGSSSSSSSLRQHSFPLLLSGAPLLWATLIAGWLVWT